MSILLNYPALLWLMALAAVPVIIHLIARSRPPEHSFSSVHFLKNIVKKSTNYRKPKDRLVLLLRTLAAAALLFAFLHPLLVSKDPTEVAGADKNIIIIIDRSASMSAKQGSTSRFTEACNQASTILSKTNPEKANVIWIDANPDSVFPAPGPNLSFLSQQLQQAEPVSENGAISTAIKLAVDQLSKVNGNREIVLISDFQKSAWENAEIFIPNNIKFSKVIVGDKALANVAIDQVTASPRSPVSGQSVAISARIKNYSETPKSTTIYLNAGGGRQSKDIEIPANGQTEVEFQTEFNHHGNIEVTTSLTEDQFRGDDHRHMIIRVRESLRLLSLVTGTSEKSAESRLVKVLDRLSSALPWLSHSISKEIPEQGTCDVLIIHQWNGKNSDALIDLSEKGTTIIVTPSEKCNTAALQQLLDLAPIDSLLTVKKNPKGYKAQMAKESAAVFSIFRSGEFGNPAQGSFFQRYELPKAWANTSIINYTDGTPAILLTKKASAARLIWNLSFDPELSNWIGQEPFVTFMAELLLHIQPNKNGAHFELLTGAPLSWILPDNIDHKIITLIPTTGDHTAIPTELKNTKLGSTLQSKSAAKPGIYQWRTGSTTAHSNFVNFPATESNLIQLDPAQLPEGETADKDSIVRADALSQGVKLWPWLLAAVLLLLISESLAATTTRHKPSA